MNRIVLVSAELFGESAGAARRLSLALILAGIVGLKPASDA